MPLGDTPTKVKDHAILPTGKARNFNGDYTVHIIIIQGGNEEPEENRMVSRDAQALGSGAL